MDDDKDRKQDEALGLQGAGQGGGTGGTIGNELVPPGAEDAAPAPNEDVDAWEKPAYEDVGPPREDYVQPRGFAGEDVGETEGGDRDYRRPEPIPGAKEEANAETASEGGAGRP
jgi:hypothetical protein